MERCRNPAQKLFYQAKLFQVAPGAVNLRARQTGFVFPLGIAFPDPAVGSNAFASPVEELR